MSAIAEIKSLLISQTEKIFKAENKPLGKYAAVKWPALIPLVRYETEYSRLDGFGARTLLNGKIFGGIRSLSCTLTPFEGASIPLVLIDVMEVQEKCTVFIEYFDKTAQGADMSVFEKLKGKYSDLEDYPASPTWYSAEQSNCSLIKIAPSQSVKRLVEMVADLLKAYLELAEKSEKSADNIKGIVEFSEKMGEQGTSAMEVLKKRLGAENTKEYYCTVFIPQK